MSRPEDREPRQNWCTGPCPCPSHFRDDQGQPAAKAKGRRTANCRVFFFGLTRLNRHQPDAPEQATKHILDNWSAGITASGDGIADSPGSRCAVQRPARQNLVSGAGHLQQRFDKTEFMCVPAYGTIRRKGIHASRMTHQRDVWMIGAGVTRKSSLGHLANQCVVESAMRRRHRVTSQPEYAVMRPPSQPVKDDIEGVCPNLPGCLHQHRQPSLRHIAEESLREVEGIATHATPATVLYGSLGQNIQLIESNSIRPQGEKQAPRYLFSHATTGRPPRSRCPRRARRSPDVRPSFP